MVLAAGELAILQTAAAELLDKTADIQRNSSNAFVLGQPTEDWQSILGSPPVLVAAGLAKPSQAIMQEYAGLIGNMQAWIVKFASGQDIQARDRVVIAGMTLTVQASLNPESYSTLNRVLATRIG